MTTTIWKFRLPITDQPAVAMPRDATILSAHYQDGGVSIWALVEPDALYETRLFSVRGTGHPTDGLEDVPFVGTVLLTDSLVFHIWDGVPVPNRAPKVAEVHNARRLGLITKEDANTLLERAAQEADRGYLASESCDDIAARIRAMKEES